MRLTHPTQVPGRALAEAGVVLAGATLPTLALAPVPASDNIGDLGRELAHAQQHSGIGGLRLVEGTEPFRGVL